MNHLATLASLIAAPSIAADFTAWQYTQPVEITTAGLHSLVLPPETLNVARPALEDLRVISPTGVETPFVINWPEVQPVRLVEPEHFDMKLADGVTELTMTTGTTDPIRAIHLRPAAAKFLKALRIETSSDGTNWQPFLASGMIFREPNNAESVTVKLPPQSHAHLRVLIDDRNSRPIAFSGAQLELGKSVPDAAPLATSVRSREELQGRTQLTVYLGGRNVFIASLQIAATDPVFSRRVTVSMPAGDGADGKTQTVASTTIFRIALGEQTSSSLDIPIHRAVASDRLIIEIDNGDSPPLKIANIETTQHPVRVFFHAVETGAWRLVSGNPIAAAPRYDIAAIKHQLTGASARQATPGALASSKSFEKPTALPEVDAKGISIDLKRCRFRKPIAIHAPGVIQVDLDTELLAHSDTTLRDLRLVQDGRQIPFIIEQPDDGSPRFVEPTVTVTPDPKRPRVTIWTVTMPLDSLPASRLTCTSPTPLFDRQIEAQATVKDSFGNDTRLYLGSARWTRKPRDASAEYTLALNRNRLPGMFTLETDNGDNSPIDLANVRVHYPTVQIIAKITKGSPAFLYYGNDRALQPQYDLQLVRAELASAPKEQATLGTEEKLAPGRKDERSNSSGSPWLWLALGAVVGVLLWVVAKMLPAASDRNGAR